MIKEDFFERILMTEPSCVEQNREASKIIRHSWFKCHHFSSGLLGITITILKYHFRVQTIQFNWICCNHIIYNLHFLKERFFSAEDDVDQSQCVNKTSSRASVAANVRTQGKCLQQLLTNPKLSWTFNLTTSGILSSLLSNRVEYNIVVRTWPLSIQQHASFLLALDPLQ